jgi:hypothetical protein
MASHVKQVVGYEQPSPSRMGEGQWVPTKETGQCSQDLLRHMGGGIKGMNDDPKQRRSRWQSAWRTSLTARRQELSRLAETAETDKHRPTPTAPRVYSTNPHARFERRRVETGRQ